MNVQARDLLSGRKALLGGACGALLVASLLGGCAVRDLTSAPFTQVPTNETSPAAAQIDAVLAKPGDYPTFASIPQPPTDLPTSDAFKAQIEDQQAEGLFVSRSAAPETWYLDASEAFAARAQADAGAGNLHPPTDAEIAESEAFAAAMRARAKPPSRPR